MAAATTGVTGTSDATVPYDPPHVCMECGERHPFDMPADLLADALAGKLVIFAGAGISTETRLLLGHTFGDTCRNELGDSADGLDFPNLMTAYEARFGRAQLLQRVRGRFEYIRSFPRLQMAASRFHHELATMPFLTEILTTNWDTYFESFASATPIVIPDDYAFWSLPGRKVIKLHGSMNNLVDRSTNTLTF
jgi:NAD-dependent SIR2 family protein deacetylase